VYPHVRLYRPAPPTLLFIASQEPIEPERDPVATRAALTEASDHYGRLGLNVVEDLVASLALDDEGSRAFAGSASVITDDANRFAVASVFDSGRSLSAEGLGELLAPYEPLLRVDDSVHRDPQQPLAMDYVARRIQAFIPVDGSARPRLERLTAWLSLSKLRTERDTVAPESALARAVGLAALDDWGGVAALDDALAQIPWTSRWNRQVLRLRVDWRLHSPDTASRSRLDAESVAMIDRFNVIEPDPRLYLRRALSAGTDPYVLQESLFRYTLAILQSHGTVDDNERQQFAALRQQFGRLRFEDPVEQHHHAEVRSTVEAVAANLQLGSSISNTPCKCAGGDRSLTNQEL